MARPRRDGASTEGRTRVEVRDEVPDDAEGEQKHEADDEDPVAPAEPRMCHGRPDSCACTLEPSQPQKKHERHEHRNEEIVVHGPSEVPVKEVVGTSHEPTARAVDAEERAGGADRIVAGLIWVDGEDEQAASDSCRACNQRRKETPSSWSHVDDHRFDYVVVAGVITSIIG